MSRVLTVKLHADVRELLTHAALAARPRETGGLLLGWWDTDTRAEAYPDAHLGTWSNRDTINAVERGTSDEVPAHSIVIRHALEIPDPEATPSSWSRSQDRAQSMLDTALTSLGHPWLGYVGDWHTHPAARDASSQDRASIRHASRQYLQPLALLVHRKDEVLDHVIALRGRIQRSQLLVVEEPDFD